MHVSLTYQSSETYNYIYFHSMLPLLTFIKRGVHAR